MDKAYGLGTTFRKAVLAIGFGWLLMAVPAAAEPVRLLILGDSLTAGYGLAQPDGFQARLATALAAKGLDVKLIDGAVSGDTTAGGLARLDWVLADGADAAIVELGANDGLRGSDPAAMEANLNAPRTDWGEVAARSRQLANALPRLGVTDVSSVRIGRRIEIEFAGEPDLERAREIADKLLANPVIEDFDIHVLDDATAEVS